MKNSKIYSTLFIPFLIICLLVSPLFSQVPKTKPRVKQKVNPRMEVQIALPDLTASNFQINTQAKQKINEVFAYPFEVTIHNKGRLKVADRFYVEIQTYATNAGRWGRTARANCIPINVDINPSGHYRLTGIIRLVDFEVSDKAIRLRAFADFGCNREFPPINGDISEFNENNNFSNEQNVGEDYSPRVIRVSPDPGLRTAQLSLIGLNFGHNESSHVVKLTNGTDVVTGIVDNWTLGIIYFTVPPNTKSGTYQACIATKGTLVPVSNSVNFRLMEERVFVWDNLFVADDIFGLTNSVNVKLHTLKGTCGYENISTATIFGQTTVLDIPIVQEKNSLGTYRWLINHFNTKEDGVTMYKSPTRPSNQLVIDLEFESGGIELRGCHDPLGPMKFNDLGCPDIQINNGVLSAILDLRANGDALDYSVIPIFNASITPHAAAWGPLIDLVDSGWKYKIKGEVEKGVKQGLEEPNVRNQITTTLMGLVRLNTGTLNKTITSMTFEHDGIHLFVY